jgi:Cys-tRNA(Pro) deacylase|tara:strand:+ start:1750 stop:2229 length:480 start_codon:yes stop_codon:yes gene_type:complete
MDLLQKETVIRVSKILKDFDETFSVTTLENSARTANEAAASLNCEVGAIVKSLIFKTENSFILCLVSGDKKVSLNKIKKFLKVKDVSMADAEDVKKITGFTIGGVSPIGHLNKIDVYIDKSLERFSNLFAAAGHPNCIFKIDFLNLQKITKGLIKEFTE